MTLSLGTPAMQIDTLLITFIAALLGSGVSTWTGFGAATILTPVLASFIELRQAVLVVAIYHGIHNLVKLVAFRKNIAGRIAGWFGSSAVVFSVLGGMLSAVAPVAALKIVLGGFLILDAVLGFLEKAGDQRKSPGFLHALVGGASSGFAAGIIGTGGAVRALFLHRFVPEKNEYVATAAVVGLIIDASRIPVYATQFPQTVTMGLLPITITAVAGGLIGLFLARSFLKDVTTERFRKFLFTALIAAGAMFILQGIGI
jgi:uncharacterized membrane protein YfcA